MHDEFQNQRHGTFFFIATLNGIFFARTVVMKNLKIKYRVFHIVS
jgi:hypothetical protein